MPTSSKKEERKLRKQQFQARAALQAQRNAEAKKARDAATTWAAAQNSTTTKNRHSPKTPDQKDQKASPKDPKEKRSPKTAIKASRGSRGVRTGFKVDQNSRTVAQMYVKNRPDTLPFLEIQLPSGEYIRPDGDTVSAQKRAEWRDRLRHALMTQNGVKYLGLTSAALGPNPRLRYGNKSRPFNARPKSTNRELLELASRISFFLDAGAHPYTWKSNTHKLHLDDVLQQVFHSAKFLPPSNWRSNAIHNMVGWARSDHAKEFRKGQ